MDKHLAVSTSSRFSLSALTVLLVETGAKILCHAIHSCICGRCTMVGRAIVHPGPSVRDVLCRWCLEGSVSFGSPHRSFYSHICRFLPALLDSKSLGIATCSKPVFSNSGFHNVVSSFY